MGREVRKIKAGWQHPKHPNGNYIGLFDGSDYAIHCGYDVDEDEGPPDPKDYMPQWSPDETTMFVMYETVSEGTPTSPAFETPEALARWLADNDTFVKATYEQWLKVCNGAYAPTLVMVGGVIKSGVASL